MRKVLWILPLAFLTLSTVLGYNAHSHESDKVYPNPSEVSTPTSDYNPVAKYEGEPDENLSDVMVPIPMADRVPNKTGIQCVWSSIETLARYAKFKKLYDMTELPECRSYSGPSSAGRWLKSKNVRFEQTTGGDRSLIIKGVVKEKRGVLFSVPGHAMVLVHYDEEKGIVKYINNSDSTLQVRTWTMKEFNRRFDGWVLLIYADDDILGRPPGEARSVPILDKNNPQGEYPESYIPMPIRKED
jgi:hypothetical protein